MVGFNLFEMKDLNRQFKSNDKRVTHFHIASVIICTIIGWLVVFVLCAFALIVKHLLS
jgi:hypothetical protein